MITSNTSIPFVKAENSENKFYLSRLTSEYNEGDSITTSTAINCRKLAIAIKAGDKITINGTSLTVYADAAVDATSFFVEEITLDEALNINANIAIDEDNMFVQYQRKTEGTVAGFDIDADGMSKGGVEITGWLDSDTMEGATENNIPTAQSVKAYVDTQVGSADTLQEVTDNGNTTTNSITTAGATLTDGLTGTTGTFGGNIVVANDETYKTYIESADIYGNNHLILRSVLSYLRLISPNNYIFYRADDGHLFQNENGTNEWMRITSAGNVGIGTTSPAFPLDIKGATNALQLTNSDYVSGSAGSRIRFTFGSSTGNTYSKIQTTDTGGISASNLILQSDSGNVGIGTTSPGEKLEVDGNIKVGDAGRLYIGDSNDLQIYHDGSNSLINNTTGHLYIYQKADDKDIIFMCDDGSGGNTAYLTLDGSAGHTKAHKEIQFEDNVIARFGDGNDMSIYHDGSNSYINQAGTGNLIFQQTIDNKDIVFISDDGSGGVTPYLTLDGSEARTNVSKDLRADDGINLSCGTSGDLNFRHDGTDSHIDNWTNDLTITNYSNEKDIIFQSDDGSGGVTAYLTLDGSQETVNVYKNLLIGTTTDNGVNLNVDGTALFSGNTYVEGTGNLTIRNTTGSGSGIKFIDTIWQAGIEHDSGNLYFRTGGQTDKMVLRHNGNLLIGTTTDSGSKLQVEGSITLSNNSDVKFKNSVGTPVGVMRFNSSNELVIFNGNSPNGDIFFKDGGPTGTTNLMIDGATGNVLIGTTTDSGYKLDVNGTQRVQDVLELDDVLTLNAISTPDDPADGKSSIYMDSADGNIKVKINVGGEVVTRTIASYDG